MTDDIRDLLAGAAPEPSQPADVATIVGAARRRRVARRGLTAVSSLAVVALVTGGAFALSSGGSTNLAVRSESPTTTTLAPGWSVVSDDSAGVSLAVPPGWSRTAAGNVANEVLTVGSAERPGPGPIVACDTTGHAAPSAVSGTWVSLLEYPSGSTTIAVPGGDTIQPLRPVPPRPADFRTGPDAGGGTCADGFSKSSSATSSTLSANTTIPTTTVPATTTTTSNQFDQFVFKESGRLFLARIVTIGSPDATAATALGQQILNTLHVDPVAGATTTTVPDSTTTTAEPATTTLPPAGAPADEQAIRAAFLGWLQGKTLDATAPYVENFASIRDAEAQGMAQHTPQDLAGFDGRVESVVVADPTHADVVYTLLHDGQPLYANRPGKAVKVDGKWKVTRDTACALLSMGAITCP